MICINMSFVHHTVMTHELHIASIVSILITYGCVNAGQFANKIDTQCTGFVRARDSCDEALIYALPIRTAHTHTRTCMLFRLQQYTT